MNTDLARKGKLAQALDASTKSSGSQSSQGKGDQVLVSTKDKLGASAHGRFEQYMDMSYSKLQELEAEITPNTKREIKGAVEQLGQYFRRMIHYAKFIAKTDKRETSINETGDSQDIAMPQHDLKGMDSKMERLTREQVAFQEQLRLQQLEWQQKQQSWMQEQQSRHQEWWDGKVTEIKELVSHQHKKPAIAECENTDARQKRGNEDNRPPEVVAPHATGEITQPSLPPHIPNGQQEWTIVAGKKNKSRRAGKVLLDRTKDPVSLVRSRKPRSEAVTICEPREGTTYADVMKRVMEGVNLKEIDVEIINTRRTKTGAILLEVKEKEAADLLAGRIRDTIGESARVTRPTRTTKVLVVGIADWLEEDRVIEDIRRADNELVSAKITVRDNFGGGRVATIDAPMATAVKLAEAKHIRVGYGQCRVKLLERKTQRCYRCHATDHLAAKCTAAEQTTKCFRCRQPGHHAANCSGKPATPVERITLQQKVPAEATVRHGSNMPEDDGASTVALSTKDGN